MVPGLAALDTLTTAGSGAVRTVSKVVGGFGDRLREALASETKTAEAPTSVNNEAAAVRSLAARIRGLLASEGTTLTEPVTLVQDQFDRIRVQGGHPQQDRIESLLATNPEVGDTFRTLAARLLNAQNSGATVLDGLPTAYEAEGKPTFALTVRPTVAAGL